MKAIITIMILLFSGTAWGGSYQADVLKESEATIHKAVKFNGWSDVKGRWEHTTTNWTNRDSWALWNLILGTTADIASSVYFTEKGYSEANLMYRDFLADQDYLAFIAARAAASALIGFIAYMMPRQDGRGIGQGGRALMHVTGGAGWAISAYNMAVVSQDK